MSPVVHYGKLIILYYFILLIFSLVMEYADNGDVF